MPRSDVVARPTLPTAAEEYRRAGHWRDRTHLQDLRDERERDPERTVLVDRSRGGHRRLAVRDLADGVERLAAALRAHAGPGDRLAYRLSNRWETVALFHACGRLGAVAVPLPASLGSAQVEQRLRATDAVLVADDDGGGLLDLDDLPAEAEPPSRDDEIGPDDVALVLFTSGTTGTSKAVLHTANSLHASTRGALGTLVLEDPGRDPRVMTPSVATHAIGVMTSALSPLLHDHCAVLDDDGSPEAVLCAVREEEVTHLLVGPRGYDALLDALGPGGPGGAAGAPPSLRMIALGGAPLSRGVLAKADRLPIVLRIHWGMTELPGGGVSRGLEAPGTSWQTMGHAVPGLERELRPVEGGNAGGDHTLGEVYVRGPQLTVGLVDSGNGSVVWTPRDDDGWYGTGDIARRDETGELAFVDRDSDEIKGSSGMLIPGGEVEGLLETHPDVDEVVLVAYHPAEQAEAPAAVVVPVGGRAPSLSDLQAHLRDQGTTEWYLPERLELVDVLPRDAQGKVDKKALRARIDGE